MRLGCPKCGALYEVPAAEIPAAGRELQCSACEHRWFHPPAPSLVAEPDEPEDEAETPPPTAAPRPRPVDPAVLKILREEAARELEARRRESAGTAPADAPRETGEMGETVTPRRILLPEIEEEAPAGARRDRNGTVVHRAPDAPARRGFAAGFVLALVLGGLAAAAYHWSAELAQAVPALAEPLGAYVEAIDALRHTIATAAGRAS